MNFALFAFVIFGVMFATCSGGEEVYVSETITLEPDPLVVRAPSLRRAMTTAEGSDKSWAAGIIKFRIKLGKWRCNVTLLNPSDVVFRENITAVAMEDGSSPRVDSSISTVSPPLWFWDHLEITTSSRSHKYLELMKEKGSSMINVVSDSEVTLALPAQGTYFSSVNEVLTFDFAAPLFFVSTDRYTPAVDASFYIAAPTDVPSGQVIEEPLFPDLEQSVKYATVRTSITILTDGKESQLSKELLEVVRYTALAASVIGAFTSSGSIFVASLFFRTHFLLSQESCNFDANTPHEPLPFEFYPIGVSLELSSKDDVPRYHLGALLLNTAIVVGVFIIHAFATITVGFCFEPNSDRDMVTIVLNESTGLICFDGAKTMKRQFTSRSRMANCMFPHLSFIVVFLFLGPTTSSLSAVFTHSDMGGLSIVVAALVAFVWVVFLGTFVVMLLRLTGATFIKFAQQMHVSSFLFGAGQWTNEGHEPGIRTANFDSIHATTQVKFRGAIRALRELVFLHNKNVGFLARFGVLRLPYSEKYCWFGAVEIFCLLDLGIFHSFYPVGGDCTSTIMSGGVVFLLYSIGVLLLHPHPTTCSNIVYGLVSVLHTVSALLLYLVNYDRKLMDGATTETIASWLTVLGVFFTAAKVLFDLVFIFVINPQYEQHHRRALALIKDIQHPATHSQARAKAVEKLAQLVGVEPHRVKRRTFNEELAKLRRTYHALYGDVKETIVNEAMNQLRQPMMNRNLANSDDDDDDLLGDKGRPMDTFLKESPLEQLDAMIKNREMAPKDADQETMFDTFSDDSEFREWKKRPRPKYAGTIPPLPPPSRNPREDFVEDLRDSPILQPSTKLPPRFYRHQRSFRQPPQTSRRPAGDFRSNRRRSLQYDESDPYFDGAEETDEAMAHNTRKRLEKEMLHNL